VVSEVSFITDNEYRPYESNIPDDLTSQESMDFGGNGLLERTKGETFYTSAEIFDNIPRTPKGSMSESNAGFCAGSAEDGPDGACCLLF